MKIEKEVINKNKEWTYHVSCTFYDNTEKLEHSIVTQLFQVGVYLIQDNNPNLQFNLTPEDMVKSEIELKILIKKGEILDLQFGREITVIQDKNGMYIEKPKIVTNETMEI